MPSNTPRAIVTTPNANDFHHDIGSLQSAAGNSRPQAGQANSSSVSGRSRSRVPNPSSTHAPPHGTQPWRGSGSSGMRNATHFQGSRRTTISGGQFLNTLGHHTNLTVNLNQPGYIPSGEDESPSQGSHPDASATVRDVDRLNELRNRNMQAVMQLPVQRSNEIYERHLMLKGRGFPLWIPEPNKNLSMIYQRQGISIGDVGLITYAGSFSFLFNIFLPADHPINPRIMPEGFAPIDPPIDPGDVRRFTEFKSGSFLGSNSIVKSSEPDDNPLSFESQSSEGAILVMPEGAVSYDFENIPQFRKYIAANLESWYRYANGPRGREAKNGDLRIVVGCDKSTSWGMATMSNLSQEHNSRLTLLSKKTEQTDSQNPQPVGYTWEYSGVAEVRAGPDPEEIEELRVDDPEPSIKYANQSLFIRTLNPTLGSGLWEKLNRDLGLSDLSDVHTEQDPDSVNPTTQQNRNDQLTPSNSKSPHTTHSGRRHAGSIPDDFQEGTQKGDDVNSSLNPEIKQRFHPSINLNRFLSETYPQARIIITEDRDWYSVIKEEEIILPPDFVLYWRTLNVSNIEYDDGDVLYLKKKDTVWHPSPPDETQPVGSYTSSYFHSSLSSPKVTDDSQVLSTTRTVDLARSVNSLGYTSQQDTIQPQVPRSKKSPNVPYSSLIEAWPGHADDSDDDDSDGGLKSDWEPVDEVLEQMRRRTPPLHSLSTQIGSYLSPGSVTDDGQFSSASCAIDPAPSVNPLGYMSHRDMIQPLGSKPKTSPDVPNSSSIKARPGGLLFPIRGLPTIFPVMSRASSTSRAIDPPPGTRLRHISQRDIIQALDLRPKTSPNVPKRSPELQTARNERHMPRTNASQESSHGNDIDEDSNRES
ncbi:hypothetical protein CPC08DRAFT_707792 [Agrocybe pediades]|nr:hypothetical protein CPC08DRAFT_707792 [Agrocybe pediades]